LRPYLHPNAQSRTAEILQKNESVPLSGRATLDRTGELSEQGASVSYPLEISVVLGDENINATLINLNIKHHEFYPIKRLADVYDQLLEQANDGDSLAANALAQGLESCTRGFSDKQELDASIAKLKGELIYSTPSTGHRDIPVTYDDLAELEAQMLEEFEFCDGVTESQQREYLVWGERSADSGDFIGINFMISDAIGKEDRLQSFYWLEKAWEINGHVGATESLAVHYSRGWFPSSDGTLSRPDFKMAYAYHLLSKVINLKSNQINYPDSTFAANYLSQVDEVDQYITANLSPSEQKDAERIAAKLLRDNEHCCYGNWNSGIEYGQTR